ncbi:MAG: DUF1579 domain-containing protein [Phycisphaera sp.]|nr:MAG: DUF1579 domain-containing protein [Phycisphaera sp.]
MLHSTTKIGLTLAAGIAGGFMLNASLAPSHALQPEGEMPDMDEMMAQMAILGTPNEHHEKLTRVVGEWDVNATFMMPDGSEMKGTGSMNCKQILDGRFIKTDFRMPEFMGMPFIGIGYNGYDNSTQSYQGVWMDSMSTKMFIMDGEFNSDGEYIATGATAHGTLMKIVQSMPDDDTIEDNFYDSMDGGATWIQSGTMVYTRK